MSRYGINSNHHKSDSNAPPNRFPDFPVIRPSNCAILIQARASHSCAWLTVLTSVEPGLKKKKKKTSERLQGQTMMRDE